jgi:hypothetical protein
MKASEDLDFSRKIGPSMVSGKNEYKKGKESETELKKTGIGPIFESPQDKNRRKQCRSTCTIHRKSGDFNRSMWNIPAKKWYLS